MGDSAEAVDLELAAGVAADGTVAEELLRS